MMANSPYVQQIVNTANQYGVDPNMALAVAYQESGINPAVSDSPTGAIGMFQLEPSTAENLGVNPRNVSQNIDGGIRYLKQMQDKYNGNPALTLASYNAGPGRVDEYVNNGRPLPSETQNYVKNITDHISNGLSNVWGGVKNAAQGALTPFQNAFAGNNGNNQMPVDQQQPILSNPALAGGPGVLFGGNQTPLGGIAGLLRSLGVGSDEGIGRRLQNAGAGLLAVGNWGRNGAAGAAALQNAANMPLFRQRFMMTRNAFGVPMIFNTHTGGVSNIFGQPLGGQQTQQPQVPVTANAASVPDDMPQATPQPQATGVPMQANGSGQPAPGVQPITPAQAQQTALTNAYVHTPLGMKALQDSNIEQSTKSKTQLEQAAQDAIAMKNLADRQIALANNPNVIQGSFAEPREMGADALSYLTGKRYGYSTSALTDEFNKNNAQITAMNKRVLGNNVRTAGPEIAFLKEMSPSNDKQMGANIAIYNHMKEVADRAIYAANLARNYPVLTPQYYQQLNNYFSKNPIATDTQGPNPGAQFAPNGNVDPNAFWKK